MRKYNVQESNNVALGQAGFDVLGSQADPHTGSWFAVKAVGAITLLGNLLTSAGDDILVAESDPDNSGTEPSGFIIEDGEILYGPFTSVTVIAVNAGGSLIAYRQ